MPKPLPEAAEPATTQGRRRDPVRAWIGLGANLGARQVTLERAIDALRQVPLSRLVARSRLWRSAPVQAHGPEFLNAVTLLETRLDSIALLEHLQAIEARFGRERPYPNAPRTLDLDLLMFGNEHRDTPMLQLPHPRMHLRAFVLAPLLELAPDLEIPSHGRARDLLDALQHQTCSALRPS
ncbi:MAG: 2-amino-4-hydroxy-6-hydroxymethyldihydropteridine diphosphokinase [Burkholderiaceae bacterium]